MNWVLFVTVVYYLYRIPTINHHIYLTLYEPNSFLRRFSGQNLR